MPLDTPLALTDRLFFAGDGAALDRAAAEAVLGDALAGAEDGELFLEYRESEAVSLDDGRIRSASFDATRGFGLRAVLGEAAGYAHAGELSEAALRRAGETVKAVRQGRSGRLDVGPRPTNARLYEDANPLPAQRGFGQLAGMGVARRLAGHGAQAEAARRVEGRGADAAVVERDALALAVLQEQFAVVGAGQRFARQALRDVAVQFGEEAVGDGQGRVERHGLGGASGKGFKPGRGKAGTKPASAAAPWCRRRARFPD